MPEDRIEQPEEHPGPDESEEKGEVASGPGGKISEVNRSFQAAEAPELTRQQLEKLRHKLKNKFH